MGKNISLSLFKSTFSIAAMTKLITKGIQISVETFYQREYSNPLMNEYMFAYRITIDNYNGFPIKLLSRKWFIHDSNASLENVEGEGVIGQQPVIQPDEHFQYVSGCSLRTDVGKMHGFYIMENQHSYEQFEVAIPEFIMVCPDKLN